MSCSVLPNESIVDAVNVLSRSPRRLIPVHNGYKDRVQICVPASTAPTKSRTQSSKTPTKYAVC